MARSVYIYLVIGDDPAPLAAFTVKHELATWLDRQYGPADTRTVSTCPIGVCRTRDGHYYPDDRPVWLNPRTLEPVT